MELERLKFLERVNKNSGRFIKDLSECWYWKGTGHTSGYGQYQTNFAKKTGCLFAHQASYKLFKDSTYVPSREHPCSHLCEGGKDDYNHRICVNPDHLYIANTVAENVAARDANRGNYQAVKTSGCRCGTAKFTEEQVKEILKKRQDGMLYKDIASEYNCNRRTIERLCLKRTYKQEQDSPL